MSLDKYISVKIGGQQLELNGSEDFGFKVNYELEDPENFSSKQGSLPFSLNVPATSNNDKIFNTFHKINVEDMTAGHIYREMMDCEISINGSIPLLKGYAILESATFTDKPTGYNVTMYGNSSAWIIEAQNLTLWDCLSGATHTFDVASVQASWGNFMSDENNDYVYAPVRYRQPFDGTTLGHGGDDTVNIYHLRPSLSLYWLIVRGFRELGFRVDSKFLESAYCKGLVLPWVWGSFYDIDSDLTKSVAFKACGRLPTEQPPLHNSTKPFWSGIYTGAVLGSPGGSSWWYNNVSGGWDPGAYNPAAGVARLGNGITPTGGQYVYTGNGTSGGGNDHFRMDIDVPPNGHDNMFLYSFDDSSGTMQYQFNPPAAIASSLNNISANFMITMYAVVTGFSGSEGCLAIECIRTGSVSTTTCQAISPTGGAIVVGAVTYPDGSGYPTMPTVCQFTVDNLYPGDILRFRLRAVASGTYGCTFGVFSGGYLNNNPQVLGIPSYTYNPVTQSFGYMTPNSIWSPLQSSFELTGFLLKLGNTVDFKNYDTFRNYKWLDLLGGFCDLFNVEISTNQVEREVYIEPMFGSTLPNGTVVDGYFSKSRVQDYSAKMDATKESKVSLFASSKRQIDLSFKLDSSDGAQTIWAQRWKGVYLGKRTFTLSNYNDDISDGLIAGVPGAARYVLPNRFANGNVQMQNRFFSATMHCKFPQWENIMGLGGPATQLVCIFPENATAEQAINQSYTPKIAFYSGLQSTMGCGGWRWVGDPASPYTDGGTPNAIGFNIPYMFAVDYTGVVDMLPGQIAPILSYSDENINGLRRAGLLSQFYLQRFAIMRNGQMLTTSLNLNLNDICNWAHKECIMMNSSLYAMIRITDYNPLVTESTQCDLWKVVPATNDDLANVYPSQISIFGSSPTLNRYDMKYARLLIYPTDLPQIN